MWFDLLLVIAGIGLLTIGGEVPVSGALGFARRLQISTLLTGLVVGSGTSMPELVASMDAALIDQPGIALGIVVGSNIGNVLLLLGLCAVVRPLPVTPLGPVARCRLGGGGKQPVQPAWHPGRVVAPPVLAASPPDGGLRPVGAAGLAALGCCSCSALADA